MNNQSQQLAALTAPFPQALIQFRAGATTKAKDKAMALAYVEPRDYEDRLNAVFGLDWSCCFKPWGNNKVICELTILDTTRSSTGEANEGDGFAIGTAAEAQAFKRACSKFGLGRELYNYPKIWVEYDNVKKQLVWGKTQKPYLVQETQATPQQQTITVEQFKPQSHLASHDDVLLSKTDAAALHKHLGGTYGNYVNSSEHKELASYAIGEEVGSFTNLTRHEAKLVAEYIREIAIERRDNSTNDKAKAVLNY